MFKFKFTHDEDSTIPADENKCDNQKCEINWEESKEIVPKDQKIENILNHTQVNSIVVYNETIKYLSSNQVVAALKNENDLDVSVLKAEQNHSDLLPGIYEGGLKIWECTYDLLHYIADSKLFLDNKKVLDLGCGAGLIGILTLLKGSTCYFQDYNCDVLEYITAPNIILNLREKFKQCKFYSGDWTSFADLLKPDSLQEEDKFDYIFTSETIYNTENYWKLHKVFEKLLKKTGEIFLAAKSFYFGVGGGISSFQDYLSETKIFGYSSCWKCMDGVRREILKIQFNT